MGEREEFLKALACFGCEYGEDCESDFGHVHEQCERCYESAKFFLDMEIKRNHITI